MKESLKVLVIEDSIDDYDLLIHELKKESWEVLPLRVETPTDMKKALETQTWDLILSDFSLPGFSGLEALSILKSYDFDIPFIMISGAIGEEAAIEVIRAGASDYILKNKKSRMVGAIRRELEAAENRQKNREIAKTLKDTEEQLRHMQKMEAVGQLAGGIAHDFNNMLSIVQIYCKKLKDLDLPAVGNYVDKILAVHARSVSLTKQLLVFSRRQEGSSTIFNLSDTLLGTQDMLQRLLGESIELVIESQDKNHTIKADQGQIEQVVMNLAVNARDAMPQGGTLCFKTTSIFFSQPEIIGAESLLGAYVVLEVTDTGLGMSKEVMNRIFEPFYTTKSAKNGTGLGLSIVYGIVHQHHGVISVSSEVGRGTVFKVYLPETLEAPRNEVLSSQALASGGHETILLVEDNMELRTLFSEILTSRGYKVIEAKDGQQALSSIETNPHGIDLVITDMVMPKVNGRELYRRSLDKSANIKFLYMSGYFEDSLLTKELKEETSFLQKPFSEELLLNRVRSILDDAG